MMPLLLLPVLAAGQIPAGLADHLKDAAVVHADFEQVRTLAALSRPLKASGSLVLVRDKGVLWRMAKPVAMTYVMGPKGLLTVDGAGRRERRTARDLPVVGQMGRLFQALVQGDWKALEGSFTLTGSGTPAHWEVSLVPTARAVGFPKRLRLTGGRFVERILLEEAGGDRMEITFSRQRLDAPVTEAEGLLLAQD